MSSSALILFAHGSRDPKWAEPFIAIQNLIREQSPGLRVELAFLELMSPSIVDCAASLAKQGYDRMRIVPLFLAAGRHLREDLPLLVADIHAQNSGLEISVLPPIGDLPEIQMAIARLVVEACG